MLREPKIRRLEVIFSNHFVVRGLPLNSWSNVSSLRRLKNKVIDVASGARSKVLYDDKMKLNLVL